MERIGELGEIEILSPQDSESCSDTFETSEAEVTERVRIFSKLFSLFPARDGVEGAMEAYLEETLDVPAHWLRAGCKAAVREPGRVFCPSVSELRALCARRIRRQRRIADGRDPDDNYSPNGLARLDPARELRWARGNPGPLLPAGQTVAGWIGSGTP